MRENFESFADELAEGLAQDEALAVVASEQSKADSFTYEDFDRGVVFEYLAGIKDEYEQNMEERRVEKQAEVVGFKNFKRSLTLYKKRLKSKASPVVIEDGKSDFQAQSMELNTGDWHADEGGIWKYGNNANQIVWACTHPIMPIQRMRSIDTGELKYRLAFHRGYGENRPWNDVIIEASDMLSPTEIVKKLAPRGISISGGDRAKAMVDYLRDMCDANYENIPEVKSISRMGWNDEGFSPYVGGIAFDGASAFYNIYNSIKQAGTMDAWLAEALDARKHSITAKIVLAASFAAPLIEPLGVQPFFVHLWSTASGTGKTVAQMLGASVWANPTIGGAYFPTFRSTSVGFEMIAGFLHSMPLFIDELQLAKDSQGKVRFNVYELASGTGKLRSNKSLGLNYTPKWNICFITSGETPMVSDTDGEGAMNRVIEIECYAGESVIADGHRTANAVKENYGHAGKAFVDALLDGADKGNILESVKAKIVPIYDGFFEKCMESDTTGKQANSAAAILTADKLATDWIFHDGNNLTLDEIAEFLKTKERVSLMDRGYDILCDWCAVNANKLRGYREDDKGECYGVIEDNVAYIFKNIFDKVCADNKIDSRAILSHLKTKGLIQTSTKGYTKSKRMSGDWGVTRPCVCLCLSTCENDLEQDVDQLPF